MTLRSDRSAVRRGTRSAVYGSCDDLRQISPPHGVTLCPMTRSSRQSCVLLAVAVLLILLPRLAWAQATTAPGEFIVEPPTLLSLGFEWKISGDDNRNARVEASYRRKGEQPWRQGLPLLRIHHEQVNGGADVFVGTAPTAAVPNGVAPNAWHYDTGNLFAGSILNLEPDTE